jgi:hypothetical protein
MRYVVDIDDTIFITEPVPMVNYTDYGIVDINEDLINAINKLYDEGNTIIIYTARHWLLLEKTKKQLSEYGVKYTTLVCGKPVGDYYINDKGVKPEEFLEEVLKNAK